MHVCLNSTHQVLGVQVHQLDVVLRDFGLVLCLERQGDLVTIVSGSQRDVVVVACALEYLGQTGRRFPSDMREKDGGSTSPSQVHAKGDAAVTAVLVEALALQEDSDKGDVRGVHRLQRHAGRGTVP